MLPSGFVTTPAEQVNCLNPTPRDYNPKPGTLNLQPNIRDPWPRSRIKGWGGDSEQYCFMAVYGVRQGFSVVRGLDVSFGVNRQTTIIGTLRETVGNYSLLLHACRGPGCSVKTHTQTRCCQSGVYASRGGNNRPALPG